mmetsp:Transcript_28929/g.63795  ORF Transcript_28929/g.63795 Transcript_28929/m.63795 type:complete len:189 (-) Transcript_28929:86-652(-)
MYHFISGYTAKVAGTEMGVTEPQATFSACYGAAFIMWHPMKYAAMLSERIQKHGTSVWLINTGWTGGSAERIKLRYTRAIVDAIHDGTLDKQPMRASPVFNLQTPAACPGVPEEVMQSDKAWSDQGAYMERLGKLGRLFADNFETFLDGEAYVGTDMVKKILTGGPDEGKIPARPAGWRPKAGSGFAG